MDSNLEKNVSFLESSSLSSKIVCNIMQLNIFPNFVKCENLGCYRDIDTAINEFWKIAKEIEKKIIDELTKDTVSCIVEDYENLYFEISYNDNTQNIQMWIDIVTIEDA